ncbi:MAG: orotidine-5'-phosphate decarboxylase [Phycisphaerae bacterium]
MTTCFADRLTTAIRAKRTAAVVGIDPVLERLPIDLRPRGSDLESATSALETFCRVLIDTVAPHVPVVKINSAFFEALYEAGVGVFYRLIAYAHARGLLVIGDVKRGDIGSTAKLYARGHLDRPAFTDVDPARIPDAVTLAGYLGENAIRPFVEIAREQGRGLYILVRPSEPGADCIHEFGGDEKFYQYLARLVQSWGQAPELRGECGLSCVGAVVAPKDAASTGALRAALPHTPFLVPGFGAQGATAETCRPCFHADGSGAIVNASRSVIYAYESATGAKGGPGDWRACIAQACQRFARDVARLAGL